MTHARISPLWWPFLAANLPALSAFLVAKNIAYKRERKRAGEKNAARLSAASMLKELPVVEQLKITAVVEAKTRPGFCGDPGVSYLLETELGGLLFDVGFGPETPALIRNASRLGMSLRDVDALAISHLHPDHMGGKQAFRSGEINVPRELTSPNMKRCYLPDSGRSPGFDATVVSEPRVLDAGFGSTGPLCRSLFFLGPVEEQSLLCRLRDKGLVIITGCGHPTLPLILDMARRLVDEPLYAMVGGLHFPLTRSRFSKLGVQMQMFLGTGRPPWRRITDEDLELTIAALAEAEPSQVLVSPHDSCDYSISRLRDGLDCVVTVLEAGGVYQL